LLPGSHGCPQARMFPVLAFPERQIKSRIKIRMTINIKIWRRILSACREPWIDDETLDKRNATRPCDKCPAAEGVLLLL